MNTNIITGASLINGGQRTIQVRGHITIKDLMEANGLNEGEKVEVYLRRVIP